MDNLTVVVPKQAMAKFGAQPSLRAMAHTRNGAIVMITVIPQQPLLQQRRRLQLPLASLQSCLVCLNNAISAYNSTECQMSPTIVYDGDKLNNNFDATEALTDFIVDDRRIRPRNYWTGKQRREVHFVYDLGCEAKVTEVHLRNSHGGHGNDRCQLKFLHVIN